MMSDALLRPSPIIPVSRATKHVMDANGNWTTERRIIWRDATGWHDIRARDEQPAVNKELAHVGR